ncbi:MAG: hypothetical protein V1821_00690 [bacterium]
MQLSKQQAKMLRSIALAVVVIVVAPLVLIAIVVLPGIFISNAVYGSVEFVNDTNQTYSLARFGSGDTVDPGYSLSSPNKLLSGARFMVKGERVVCILLREGSEDGLSLSISRSEEKQRKILLSELLAKPERCWVDLEKLESNKLYHCNKSECF